MSAEAFAARFPRAAVVLEASETADVLRAAADELEALAANAHTYEGGTLRRAVRAVVIEAMYRVVDCEREP